MSENTNIQVLVRVRPPLERELKEIGSDYSESCLVQMPSSEATATHLKIPHTLSYHSSLQRSNVAVKEDEYKHYKFDECIWSFDPTDKHYLDNRGFYNRCGASLVTHLFEGYNVCLLAYGQTSSGKTHTMTGSEVEPGFIPQIILDVLRHRETLMQDRILCQLQLTYVEIYNEQVRDLLAVKSQDVKCKIREHPVTGPYVENLKEFDFEDLGEFQQLLEQGNIRRSTASTLMNERSSRSHAILTVKLKQTKFNGTDNSVGDADEEMISSIKLVDLAGSERLAKTKVYGQQDRLREGTLINKSLTVLGRCINILANDAKLVVPYRDSTLTYILKENLSGNSKTFMIFCVSPFDFEETYQTLNYATQVKTIKTAAKSNKTKLSSRTVDWEALRSADNDVIRDLRAEIDTLSAQLQAASIQSNPAPSDLLLFLERESERYKFENQFLRLKLLQKESQVQELKTHLSHINTEYSELSYETAKTSLNGVSSLISKCATHIDDIEKDLAFYQPTF